MTDTPQATQTEDGWPTTQMLSDYHTQRRQDRARMIDHLRWLADTIEENVELEVDASMFHYHPQRPHLEREWSQYQDDGQPTPKLVALRRAWVKTQLKVFVRLGFEIKKLNSDINYGFEGTRDDVYIRVSVPNQSICVIEETDETEVVTEVVVPPEVQAAYTVQKRVPVTKKHCPPLLDTAELADLILEVQGDA